MYKFALVGLMAALAACGETASPSPNGTSGRTVSTGSATVSGQSKTVLVTSSGMTLYYKTDDTATSSTCTGSCASTWPPLAASQTLSKDASVTGSMTLADGGNGSQIQYNGHFLYTYASDTAAGQASGEGLGGVWHVATPDLGSVSGSTTSAASTQSPGGYHY